jgi:hypothetical protein
LSLRNHEDRLTRPVRSSSYQMRVHLERVRRRIYHTYRTKLNFEPQIPPELQDLRSLFAFTYTEAITASGCSATPETSTEYYTARVRGSSYYASPVSRTGT